MLTIVTSLFPFILLIVALLILKPRKPLIERFSENTVKITNVGYGIKEGLPQFFAVGFLFLGIVMFAAQTNSNRLSTDTIVLSSAILISSALFFWFRSRYKSFHFNLEEAKVEMFVHQFGKSRKTGEYLLPKPLTALTVSDTSRDSVHYYWTQWNVVGGKPIKVGHETDDERVYFRDWLRQNGFTVN